MYWDGFRLENLKTMLFTDEELEKCTARKGDLLVCEGGDIGRACIWNEDFDIRIQNHIHKLRPYSKVDVKYFYYIFYLYKSLGMIGGKGIGIQGLSSGALHKLIFPLPNYNEQQRIVAKLEIILPVVVKYEKQQISLDCLNSEIKPRLRKAILQEAIQGRLVEQCETNEPATVLLEQIKIEKKRLVKEGKLKKSALEDSVIFKGDDNKYYENLNGEVIDITDQIPYDIPNTWRWVRLRSIGTWGAGATPNRGTVEYYKNGTIPWIKTGELNNGLVTDSIEKVTPKALAECSLRMACVGDVLIAMYGATIGKLAIAGVQLTTNQACCACTPFNGIYNWYLFYYLMANKEALIEMGAGGAQPNISREKIIQFLFALPPVNEQRMIVSRIELLFMLLN